MPLKIRQRRQSAKVSIRQKRAQTRATRLQTKTARRQERETARDTKEMDKIKEEAASSQISQEQSDEENNDGGENPSVDESENEQGEDGEEKSQEQSDDSGEYVPVRKSKRGKIGNKIKPRRNPEESQNDIQDVRSSRGVVKENPSQYASQNSTISIANNFNGNKSISPLSYLPMAVISTAYNQGFNNYVLQQGLNQFTAAYALYYIQNLLQSAGTNMLPSTTLVPRWIQYLFQAICPTSIPFHGGTISYSNMTTENSANVTTFLLSSQGQASNYNLGVVTGSLVASQWYLLDTVSGYTEELGSSALGTLQTFMSSRKQSQFMWEIVDVTQKCITTVDPSAYSISNYTSAKGSGAGGHGAALYVTNLDSPISMPIFSMFDSIPYVSGGVLATYSQVFSGDPIFLGGLVASFQTPEQVRLQRPPIFKFVDYWQFFDLFCQFLSKVMTLSTSDPQHQILNNNPQCPLTFLQAQYLLAGLMRWNFQSSQSSVQGMVPTVISSTNFNFIPWAMGSNCCANSIWANAQMPLFFLENLRSLKYRAVLTVGEDDDITDPQIFIPVLGQMGGTSFTTYTYTNYSTGGTPNVFTSSYSGEIALNLWDGSSGGSQYDMNAGNYPQQIVTTWNTWIASFTNIVVGLTTLDNDDGVDELQVITYTDQIINNPNLTWLNYVTQNDYFHTPNPAELKKIAMKRLDSHKVKDVESLFGTFQLDSVTGAVEIDKCSWETILQYWIKPICLVNVDTSGVQPYWNPTNIQIYGSEMFSIQFTTQSNSGMAEGPTLQMRNSSFASYMINAISAPPSNAYSLFLQLQEKGQASRFGSRIGKFFKKNKNQILKIVETGLPYAVQALVSLF